MLRAKEARTLQQLQNLGINAWRNRNAITVVIPQPSKEVCVKWQLASENGLTHIICMPGLTKEVIDCFINDVPI